MNRSFELLHKEVQKKISELGWMFFRPIQEKAIAVLTGSDKDLIISAPTASGKTEAAFLPLISRHFEELSHSLGLVYISPLKALINDQNSRISMLCSKMDIPITAWHGDVSPSIKKKLLKNPRGILMITPESIEALLLHKELKARMLFSRVHCMIIDEIHSFLDSVRGIHLYSLLNRISLSTGRTNVRKVALSATISRLSEIKKWLSPFPGEVEEIVDTDLDIRADSQVNSGAKEVYGSIFSINPDPGVKSTFPVQLAGLTGTGKNLVFSNSKNDLESACDTMKHFRGPNSRPDSYGVHHGSISKQLREKTEKELKANNRMTVFCTNTLELGIDIGDVERVILLSPPWSVSSFIQRIGRSGRQAGKPVQFVFLLRPAFITSKSSHRENLQTEIVKAVALIELYLEGYCEPYLFELDNYSCLVHELLAYLKQTGGCRPLKLYEDIILKSFNSLLNSEQFITLLRHLKKRGYIEQFKDGDILLAEKGERLAEHFTFFSVFHTPEQWKIMHNQEVIGEVPFILFYKKDDQLLLAGKRWDISDIQVETKRILVVPGKNKKEAFFAGSDRLTSKKIHRKMKEIYEKRYLPSYVDQRTGESLVRAFDYYDILSSGSTCLLHFQGSRISNTLQILFQAARIEGEDFEVGFDLKGISQGKIFSLLKKMNISAGHLYDLISGYPREEKKTGKYDDLLPGFLLDKSYVKALLDIEGTIHYINTREKLL